MKYLYLLFLSLAFTVQYTNAQQKLKPEITQVEFGEKTIILNKKHAFNYYREDNDFVISDLNDNPIITGKITPLGNKKFVSKIYFVTIGKEFHNKKIVGRNELIMALCQYNVITKDFEINNERLYDFIYKNNEIDTFPVKE